MRPRREKNCFYHAHPGALAYSFGMLGCDLHCSYCQNWMTSQALRDPAAVAGPVRIAPAELVLDAIRQGGRVIVSTYNEPLITSEWAVTDNDSDGELTRLAEFLAGVSLDIPWHVTAFHKDYKMTDPENTSAETLVRAAEIGKKAGLRYVCAGNLPGKVGDLENTSCPNCKTLLIERFG